MSRKEKREYDRLVVKNKKELLEVLESIVTSYYHDSKCVFSLEKIVDNDMFSKEIVSEVIDMLDKKKLLKKGKGRNFTISLETVLFIEDIISNKRNNFINQVVGALTIMLAVGSILQLFNSDLTKFLSICFNMGVLIYLYIQTRNSY